MKGAIEIREETMSRPSVTLNLPPIYDEEYGIDEYALSYAINLMLKLFAE